MAHNELLSIIIGKITNLSPILFHPFHESTAYLGWRNTPLFPKAAYKTKITVIEKLRKWHSMFDFF